MRNLTVEEWIINWHKVFVQMNAVTTWLKFVLQHILSTSSHLFRKLGERLISYWKLQGGWPKPGLSRPILPSLQKTIWLTRRPGDIYIYILDVLLQCTLQEFFFFWGDLSNVFQVRCICELIREYKNRMYIRTNTDTFC